MSKKIMTKTSLNEDINHKSHSPHLNTKPISNSTTVFTPLTSHKTYNEL